MGNDDDLDPDVQEILKDQTRLARGKSRQESKINRLHWKVLEAIQACDARALARELRLADVPEGSDLWKRAWQAFHSCCGQ
jgi:hypothetical protein